jgi:cell division initiation protein
MKIAPIDIAHKTFARKVMGLDPDEVADFMRDVADQMEEIIRERNAMKETLRQKELQLMEYKERDETLKSTIQTAAKMSDGIRADAERECKLIIGDAHQKADMILKDSRDQLKRVYQEIADLKRLRMQFEVNLRTICQAHIQMVDQSHMTVPDPQINFAQAQSHMNAQPLQAAPAAAQASASGGASNASAGAGYNPAANFNGGAGSQAQNQTQIFQPAAGNIAQQGFAGGAAAGYAAPQGYAQGARAAGAGKA